MERISVYYRESPRQTQEGMNVAMILVDDLVKFSKDGANSLIARKSAELIIEKIEGLTIEDQEKLKRELQGD